MYNFGIDEIERLRVARARADELRADWRSANMKRPRADRSSSRRSWTLRAREAGGRLLIGLGERLAPAELGPCR
jgi:hypothetical protein